MSPGLGQQEGGASNKLASTLAFPHGVGSSTRLCIELMGLQQRVSLVRGSEGALFEPCSPCSANERHTWATVPEPCCQPDRCFPHRHCVLAQSKLPDHSGMRPSTGRGKRRSFVLRRPMPAGIPSALPQIRSQAFLQDSVVKHPEWPLAECTFSGFLEL